MHSLGLVGVPEQSVTQEEKVLPSDSEKEPPREENGQPEPIGDVGDRATNTSQEIGGDGSAATSAESDVSEEEPGEESR